MPKRTPPSSRILSPSVARRAGAFTLVELLVVMAIISVLAALLLPVLREARESAIIVTCMSTQKQVYLAASLYTDERSGYLMAAATAHTPYPWDPWWLKTPRGALIYGGYILGPVEATSENNKRIIRDLFICPSMPREKWAYHTKNTGTYGFNNGKPWETTTFIKSASIRKPTEMIYIGDCNPANYNIAATRPNYIAEEHGGDRAVVVFMAGNADAVPEARFAAGYSEWTDHLPFYNVRVSMWD